MNKEQIEAVREQLQRSIDAFAEPLDEMALAARGGRVVFDGREG